MAIDYSGIAGAAGGAGATPSTWTGTAYATDPVAQAQAQQDAAAAAAAMAAPNPSGQQVRTTALPDGATATHTATGAPQTGATSAEDYATGKFAPFDTTGWTKQGGSSTGTVWVNDKTGQVVYLANDGRVQDTFASLADANRTGDPNVIAHDLAGQLPKDPLGTPGISGSDNPVDAFNAVKAAADKNGITINPDGTISGPGGAGGAGGGSLTGTPQYQSLVDFSNQLQTTRQNYGGGTQAGVAPVIAAPNVGPAAQMTAAQSTGAPKIDTRSLVAGAQTVAPQTIAPATPIAAPTIAAVPGATAQQIAQPGAVTAGTVGAQTIGPVGLGADASANKASQDAAQALLAGAAAGNAPSAAEALLRKGIDENEGAALGMAATFQGSRPGLALRTGLQGSRAAVAKSAADMAALRATEQATARGQYQEATTAARGQDIQAASTNLQAQIDTLKANQQTALAAGNSNAANAIQAQIATLQGQLDASKANQQAALQATLATRATQADAAKANAANQLQAQIVSMQQQIDVAKQNAANALAAGQSNQAAALQAQIATMNTQLEGLKANQASALSTATTNAGLTQQANQTNATLEQNQTQFGATQELSAAEKNQQAELMQQQLNNQQYLGMTQLQQQAVIAPYQAMVQQQQIAQQQAAANQAFWATLISAGGTALAASDATLKTDVSDGAVAALDFLDALPDPVTYRYIDEKAHYPGKQLGVIAQKLPPAVVTTGPDGKKWISANVIGQVLAGLGSVHKRLGKIEERREITRLTPRAGRDTVPPSDVADFARKLAS